MTSAATAQAHAPAPAPTDEQIALAWRQLRHRGTCPDTLAAALAHPTWGRCLRGLAVNLGRRGVPVGAAADAAARLGPARQVPPEPRAPVRIKHPRLLGVDLKRAAANDREEAEA